MKVPEKVARIAMALCLTMQLIPQAAYAEMLEGVNTGASVAAAQPQDDGVATLAGGDAQDDGGTQDGGDAQDDGSSQGNAPGATSDVEVTGFRMKWVANSSTNATVSEDGKTLTLKPSTNDAAATCAMAQYEVTLDGRDDQMLEAGSVVVRVPAHVFRDRDGNIIDTPVSKKVYGTSVTEPSGPEAPGTGTENAFNWYYDADTDEIVYTNFREMSVREGFTVRVQYQISSVQVESGATVEAGESSYDIKVPGIATSLTGTTPGLSVKVDTGVSINSADKEVGGKYESWQPAWGPAPADEDDYYYVTWNLWASVPRENTQPFSLSFDESKETNKGNTAASDDIVAWTTGNTNSTWVQEYDGKTGAEGMSADKLLVTSATRGGTPGGYEYRTHYRTVVIRYPRSATANGATPKATNTMTAVAEGVDGERAEKTSSSTYTYSHVRFEYAGDAWTTEKSSRYDLTATHATNRIGGLSVLRAGSDYTGGSWSIYASNQRAKTDSNGMLLPDDQQPDYGTVLRDGLLFIGDERLQPGDYEYRGFYVRQFDEYMAVSDPNAGLSYVLTQNTAGFDAAGGYAGSYHPVTVYTRSSFDGDWTEAGVLTKTGMLSYSFNGATYTGRDTLIPLPAGTCDVKFVHMGNQNRVELRFGLAYTLHPTDHVMGLIGADTRQFNLYNVHDAWITDAQGNKVSGGNTPTVSTSRGIRDKVIESDAAEYADGTSYHDYATHVYKAFTGITIFTKRMSLIREDPIEGVEYIRVSMNFDEYFSFSGMGLTKAEAIALGVVEEQRECKFYDLLPAGCTVDPSSIRVAPYGGTFGGTFTNSDGEKVSCSDYDYTVEMVDNWRGSGQTMMILTVQAPEGISNYDNSSSYVDSGFKCEFTMVDTFENIATNGGNLKNGAAAVSQDGALSAGRADDGGSLFNKEMFTGLNDAGSALDGEKNCIYATASITVTPTVGSEFKFKKYVKSAEDLVYKTSTTVAPTGSYSYQLLVKNDSNNKQSGIILYDVLENAYDEAGGSELLHWQGELTGVDCSQAAALGADVTVYYSTATGWDGITGRADLTDTDIWTTTAPADLSTVTAVAFDCSSASATADADHSDGNGGFVLPPDENLACYLYMRAPANYQDLMDDPATAEDETHKAYNTAFATAVRYSADEPVTANGGSISTAESNRTDVAEKDPATELGKTSDPASGTAASPASVAAGDRLTYDLIVRNANVAEAISGVTVVDAIPEGLTVDVADIRYYSNAHSDSARPCDGTGIVSVEKVGQRLTFTIDKVAARETIHLVIPTTVAASANAGMTYENTARITRYNGAAWDIESETTYHESEPVTTSVSVTKSWVDGNDSAGLRPTSVTVTLTADGIDTGKTATLSEDGGWTVTFTDLPKYNADGQTVVSYGVEEVGETSPYYDVTYSGRGSALTVTNTLSAVTVESASFDIHKSRADGGASVPGVTFGLYSDAACTQLVGQTQATDDNGNVTFAFSERGAHDATAANALDFHGADGTPLSSITLYAKELSAPHGYTVDATPQRLTLTRPAQAAIVAKADEGVVEYRYDWTVTAEGDGPLTGANGSFAMTNAYAADPVSVTLPVSKVIDDLSGRPAEKDFSFTLSDASGEVETVTVTGEGTAAFGAVTFTEPGTYSYTVSEADGGEPGYTYAAARQVSVEVVDRGGTLEVAGVAYDGSPQAAAPTGGTLPALSFTNTYSPAAAAATLSVTKAVDGVARAAGLERDFSFALSAVAGAPMPAAGAVATVTDEGEAAFGEVSFDRPGEYLYRISEDASDPQPGYSYDDKVVYARVVVTDHGGALAVDSVEYGEMAAGAFAASADQDAARTFTNTYAPTAAEVTIPVTKTITGDDRPGESDFEFTLSDASGVVETVTVTGEGAAAFAPLAFDEPGRYDFAIAEVDGGEAGYIYDGTVHDVVVNVTDAGDGTLAATWTIDGAAATAEGATFANAYEPVPVNGTIPVAKQVDGIGRTFKKDFEFTLSDASGVIDTKVITDEGATEFDPITFEHAGTYEFTVAETEGDAAGYGYDSRTITATATVTDVDGELQVAWGFESSDGEAVDEPIFVNTYAPTAAVGAPTVAKAITGDDRPGESDFEFTLSDASGVVETVTVTGEGTAAFAPLAFDEPGRYDFAIAEVDGGEAGYTYDAAAHVATAVVTDAGGALEVAWEFDGEPSDDGVLTITNAYAAEVATVTTTTTTRVTVSAAGVADTGDATAAGAGLAALAALGLAALIAGRRLARR